MHLIPLPLPHSGAASHPLPLSALAGRHVVIEEHLDGAAVDLSFDERGGVRLRSGKRPLAGGFAERPFIPLKIWAMAHEPRLIERLDDRFELHGRWTYAMRRVWYDRLPHYFHATDVLDRASGQWLSTPRRQALLEASPVLPSPVLYAGPMPTQPPWIETLRRRSLARSAGAQHAFEAAALRESLPLESWRSPARVARPAALIVRLEDARQVLARFLVAIGDGPEPLAMPGLLPNGLAAGADLFAPRPTVTWRDLGLKTLRSLGALKALSIEDAGQRCA